MASQRQLGIGADAPRLVEHLVETNREIECIKVFRPRYFLPLQDVPGIPQQECDVIQSGLRLREEIGLSFWDATLLFVSSHPVTAGTVLKHATRHNSQDMDHTVVARQDCTESHLRKLVGQLANGQILAVSSKVQTANNHFKHIPMLDFHCRESESNLCVVKTVISQLGLSGFIAKSGGSYHFYGSDLIVERELIEILGKSLLFSPIVDHRWIGHQIVERACGLRISPGKEYTWCPEIVAQV